MSEKKLKLSRREFLYTSAMATVGLAITACAGPETETVEAPPVEETVEKAVEATPTPRPTLAATATPRPTAAPEAGYNEAPQLADLVASGDLPPVDERLPANPLVLEPLNEIGTYGGTVRTFYSWEGHLLECQYGHSAVRWIDDGLDIAPGMCESWSTNEDNSEWTLVFRKGLKWSDGEPVTVDDVLFWWEDMVLDPDHSDAPPDFGTSAAGTLVEFIKEDDYTLTLKYDTPAPLTLKRLAMWVNAGIGPRWIVPKHYVEQFHPKYNDEYPDYEEFDLRQNNKTNPDMPVLNPWMLTRYEPSLRQVFERNPYYYAVDPEGNQLPYIDGIDAEFIDDAEVQKLRIMQGDIDWNHFHRITLADVGTLRDSEESGNYEVRFWDSGSGTGMMYFWNHDHPDEKLRELYRNPKFKQAMSHAMDRPRIKTVVYYETGMLTTGTMSPKAIEFNFNAEAQALYQEARDAYVDYDPELAMSLLDEIGVVDATGDGFRDFPDGSPLEVVIDVQADAGDECMRSLEIVSENWREIGLNVIINQMPGAEFGVSWEAGQLSIHTNWEVGDGPDHLLYPSWIVPNEPGRWAPLCGNRLLYKGTEREDTEGEKSPWDRQPPRFNSDEVDLIGEAVWRLQEELYPPAIVEPDEMARHELVWEMIRIHIDNTFFVGSVANYPRIIFVSKNMINVPYTEDLTLGGFVNPWIIPYPAVVNPETWSFA
ncbi:MAG: ABC transporter substrate-binding protein [Anaerolineae bacterium]